MARLRPFVCRAARALATTSITLIATSIALGIALPSMAQDEDLEGIDAIVVTITKRAENLSDVAATISAFDADIIEQVDIQGVSDVVLLIPNAQIKGDDDGGVSIRGVSQSFTSQAPVAMHLNGIWRQASRNSFLGTFYDLGSIQVQRGPVGTVYGRNATAGAMDVTWKKPHSDYEVEGDVTVGNHSLYQARGVANVPLLGEGDERLMGRFVFQRETRDDYVDQLNRRSHDGGRDLWYGRGSIRSVLGEDLEITVRGSFGRDSESESPQAKPLQVNNQFAEGRFNLGLLGTHDFDPLNGYQKFLSSFANQPGFNTVLTTLTQLANPGISSEDAAFIVLTEGFAGFGVPAIAPRLDRSLPLTSGAGQTASNGALDSADSFARTSMMDAEVLWSLHDLPLLGDIQVKALGGWDRWSMMQVPEADGTNLVILDNQSHQRRKTWVGEINISSQNESPLNWIAGFFYFDSEYSTDTGTITPFTGAAISISSIDRDSKGYAPFAQVGLRPLELFSDDPFLDFELWSGVRYNHDEVAIEAGDPGVDPINLITMLPGNNFSEVDRTFREVTYEFGFRVFPVDGHMVYAKWSKGYKPGLLEGLTARAPASSDPRVFINSVEPEVIRAWEAGWKGSFWDNRIQTALTYFHYDYSDLQVPKITDGVVQTSNAAAATNQGVELELRIQPTEEWNILLAAGWLDATFEEFCLDDELDFQDGDLSDPGCDIGGVVGVPDFNRNINVSGNDLEDSPSYSASLLTSYELDLGDMGSLTPVIRFSWTDDYYRRPFNGDDYDLVDSYTRTDFRLIWKSVDQQYEVELFVQNIEDKTIYARTIAVEIPTSAVGFGLLPPRVFGVRLGYHWGGE